jgi:hypothetical protein
MKMYFFILISCFNINYKTPSGTAILPPVSNSNFYGIIRNHKPVTTNPVGRLFGGVTATLIPTLHSILLHLYH